MARTIVGLIALLCVFFTIVGLPPFPKTDDARPLLRSGYTAFETGVRRRANGVIEVAVLTSMPGVEPEMVRWWLADYLQTADHFKRWNPRGHAWMAWEDKFPGRLIGATMQTRELIGGEMVELRTTFLDPIDFFGTPVSGDGQYAYCAAMGKTQDTETDIRMCHLVRATDWGSEVRTRIWLGHTVSREGVGPADFISNTAFIRLMTVDRALARNLVSHVTEGYSTLATFLPELYAAEKQPAAEETR